MRLGVRVGPFYFSGSTRRRRSRSVSIADGIKVLLVLAAIGWPLELGQRPGGGWHLWVWAIAVPWWILLVLFWRAGRSSTRSSAAQRQAFHAEVTQADGSMYACHHKHRTEGAAAECAQKYRRAVAAGRPVPPPAGSGRDL